MKTFKIATASFDISRGCPKEGKQDAMNLLSDAGFSLSCCTSLTVNLQKHQNPFLHILTCNKLHITFFWGVGPGVLMLWVNHVLDYMIEPICFDFGDYVISKNASPNNPKRLNHLRALGP